MDEDGENDGNFSSDSGSAETSSTSTGSISGDEAGVGLKQSRQKSGEQASEARSGAAAATADAHTAPGTTLGGAAVGTDKDPGKRMRQSGLPTDTKDKSKRDKRKQRRKVRSGANGDDGDFDLTLEALQGRWRHSLAHLGTLVVQGSAVKFDPPVTLQLEIKKLPDGRLGMSGWVSCAETSTADKVVWNMGEKSCSWSFEDDLDTVLTGGGEQVDVTNIIQGKRRRAQVDYKKLDRELPQDGMFGARVRPGSDAGSASEAEEVAEERERTPAKWKLEHEANVEKAVSYFKRWMYATRSPTHEELWQKRGNIIKVLPVKFTGKGRQYIESALKKWCDQVAHRDDGTIVKVTLEGRSNFARDHAAEWKKPCTQDAPKKRKHEQRKQEPTPGTNARAARKDSRLQPPHDVPPAATLAPVSSPPSAVAAIAVGSGTSRVQPDLTSITPKVSDPAAHASLGEAKTSMTHSTSETMPSTQNAKKRRKCRAIADSSDGSAGEEDHIGNKSVTPAGQDGSITARAGEEHADLLHPRGDCEESAIPKVDACPDASSAVDGSSITQNVAKASPAVEVASSMEDAQGKLAARPPPSRDEILRLLDYLGGLDVSVETMTKTKIGACVAAIKKLHANDKEVASAAGLLVSVWRQKWAESRR